MRAVNEQRLALTFDRDYGELIYAGADLPVLVCGS